MSAVKQSPAKRSIVALTAEVQALRAHLTRDSLAVGESSPTTTASLRD